MPEDPIQTPPTVALKTKVEDDFVSPLAAIRGLLELIRDFPDIDAEKRAAFVRSALAECARLERGIDELAETVYAAGHKAIAAEQEVQPESVGQRHDRIHMDTAANVVELDFSDFEFNSSEVVNAFYDEIEAVVDATQRKWFVIVNFTRSRVWPEAWVAFAHRGKRLTVTRSLGTFRYDTETEDDAASTSDNGLLRSREEALEKINAIKKSTP